MLSPEVIDGGLILRRIERAECSIIGLDSFAVSILVEDEGSRGAAVLSRYWHQSARFFDQRERSYCASVA